MTRSQTSTKPPKKTRRARHVLQYDAKILAKVWKLLPSYMIFLALWSLMQAGVDTVAVYFRNAMFNALDVSDRFMDVAVFILSLAVFYLIVYVPDHVYTLIVSPILENRLRYRMHAELYRKAVSMDLACYDDPDFYNQFVWAMRESDNRAISVVKALWNVVNRIISATAISALLLSINLWMGLLMLIGVGVTLVVEYFGNRLWIKCAEECTPLWRRESYITRVFNLSDYAKEMRTSRVGDMMTRDCDETADRLMELDIRYGKKFTLLYGVGFNIARRGTYYATILIMVNELAAGRVLLGGFAAAVASLWMLQSIMMNLAESLTELPKHALYIEKYFKFLEHENHMQSGSEPVPEFESLTFENVSFVYESVFTEEEADLSEAIKAFEKKEKGLSDSDEDPDGQKTKDGRPDVLRNVSFTVRRGEKTAIVGYNGAGKTTLIKLILRLYDPTEGRILYNGRDIREYDLESYRDRMGAVFQDYRIFAATLGENVMGGGYERTPENEEKIRKALSDAAFGERLEKMEEGLETPLTREIEKDGVNLSGGEAQKVAIARVFVRPYELIIMDEPSSALDPVAEYELNHSVLSAADRRDRTVIFISHRLSTTRFADRILLFAGGELAEQGSHDQLVAMNGKYAEMFRMQAEKYRQGENMS